MEVQRFFIYTALVSTLLMINTIDNVNAEEGKDSKILILGAGMSGISAAKRLKELGYTNFEIIEGSDRVGGRVRHEKLGDTTVEMGHFITMGLGTNPIWSMIKDYNVSYKVLDYNDWIVRDTNGTNVTEEANAIYRELFDAIQIMDENGNRARDDNTPDYTVMSALLKAGWSSKSILDDVIEYFTIDWLYGYCPNEISGKYAFINEPMQFINSTDQIITTDNRGLADIMRTLLNEIIGDTQKLKLSKVVSEVQQKDGQITVLTKGGEKYTGDYAIMTFSIGVMQNKQVAFKPELPEWKMDSFQQFQMAQLTNVYVQFNSSFWDDNEWIVYASESESFNIIANMNRFFPGSNILYFEAVNRDAIRIERLSDSEIIAEVIYNLKKVYAESGVIVPDPIRYKMSRFSRDPLFYGAWSSWPPGYTKDSHDALRGPVDRLYFAGEHTSMLHYGYLQGAYFSGVDAVKMLDQCIQRSVCQKYVPIYAARGCRYTAASNYDPGVKEDDGSCKFPCVSGADHYRMSLIILIGEAALMRLRT